MSRFTHAGISFELPPGWEAASTGGSFKRLADGATEPTVIHVGSFPLPPPHASFGADAVAVMGPSDVLIVIFEYGPESADMPRFAQGQLPRSVAAGQFDRAALQRGMPGQSGLQHFFTHAGRAFCIYVVLGSHIDRSDLAQRASQVLATLDIR